ncbi:virB8 family protein [Rhizobium alarense]|uniref:virB8 family protein n=1 Tax=Rhizobium alarense TaxID=2846851 RepID=UPI002E34AC46|nr:VirB8/TrbF family protein [Rhizobium alarense]
MFGRSKHRTEDRREGQRAADTNSTENPSTHAEFAQAMDWEASRIHQIEVSERRAWKVAGAFGVGFILSALGIFLMLPLKENTPYVIRVDSATGVPDIVTALDSKGVGYDEVMDKYWLAQYIRARETYDWHTLQKDYDTVGLLSSVNVGKEYAALFEGDNALDKTFGSQSRATVEVVSVTPSQSGKGIATVRFVKRTKRVADNGPGRVEQFVATIGYEYRNPSVFRESARLINPLGFQVTSYRTDSEMLGGTK